MLNTTYHTTSTATVYGNAGCALHDSEGIASDALWSALSAWLYTATLSAGNSIWLGRPVMSVRMHHTSRNRKAELSGGLNKMEFSFFSHSQMSSGGSWLQRLVLWLNHAGFSVSEILLAFSSWSQGGCCRAEHHICILGRKKLGRGASVTSVPFLS